MRKGLVLFLTAFAVKLGLATPIDLLPVNIDLNNKTKLQRGARLFMNYCSGCHSLKYMRYNRMAVDLGLTTFSGQVDEELLVNNLIFTESKPHDPIQISMPVTDGRQWFGKLPPDLSLTARERGAAWIYTYLSSFYVDKKRPFGSNNLLIPDVAMPNVLAPLQGKVIAVGPQEINDLHQKNLLLVQKGEMTTPQFDSAVQDIVTFLVYVGEPSKLVRYQIGIFVILFLLVFSIIAFLLKKAYWKNIH